LASSNCEQRDANCGGGFLGNAIVTFDLRSACFHLAFEHRSVLINIGLADSLVCLGYITGFSRLGYAGLGYAKTSGWFGAARSFGHRRSSCLCAMGVIFAPDRLCDFLQCGFLSRASAEVLPCERRNVISRRLPGPSCDLLLAKRKLTVELADVCARGSDRALSRADANYQANLGRRRCVLAMVFPGAGPLPASSQLYEAGLEGWRFLRDGSRDPLGALRRPVLPRIFALAMGGAQLLRIFSRTGPQLGFLLRCDHGNALVAPLIAIGIAFIVTLRKLASGSSS